MAPQRVLLLGLPPATAEPLAQAIRGEGCAALVVPEPWEAEGLPRDLTVLGDIPEPAQWIRRAAAAAVHAPVVVLHPPDRPIPRWMTLPSIRARLDPQAPAPIAARQISDLLGGSEIRRLQLGDAVLDLAHHYIENSEGRAALTETEARLLEALFRAHGPVSREQLLREVWGYRSTVSRAVDNTVARLRAKLEADPRRPEHLTTARGIGYQLVGARSIAAEAPAEPAQFPAPPRRSQPLHGRSEQLAALAAWWASPGRLLTIVGLPGVGKSALAHAFCQDVGVPCWYANLTDGALPLQSAASLGLIDDADPALPELLAALPPLLEAGARVIVTARTATRLSGERLLVVPPLASADSLAMLHQLTGEDDAGLPALAERLDGVPLVIELVASRLALLSPVQAVARLDRPLSLLQAPRWAPARHRSWAACVDWSLVRLSERHRQAARTLAALDGAFSRADAAQLLGEHPDDVLEALLSGSLLLRAVSVGGARFVMPALIRAVLT